ncbi:ATP-binding protein [Nitrospira sp. BLG_1]|uniref:ATP-binding protein n=1 Tax=Nitrospira sp. BLG_1 TaxID=3395883 RepID=UPI0039BD7F81
MNRFSPSLVISLCLVGITIGALVIGATLVDLDSDKRTHVFAARKTLSESLAIEYAILAASGQQSALEGALRALVARDTAIQSMAIQVIGGERLVVVGDHERYWIEPPVRQSTMTHMQVPIHKASSPWAMLQISFKPTHLSPEERWLTGAWPRFVAVVAVLTFIGALAVMTRILRYVDPSEVIPPRVKGALDSLTDSVALVDRSGSIVLANEAFCRLAHQPLASILGRSLSRFHWEPDPDGPRSTVLEYPWERAIEYKTLQQGVRLGFRPPVGALHTLSVTSMPILEEGDVVRGILVSCHDVTDVDHAKAQLRDAITKLELSQSKVVAQNEQLAQANDALTQEVEQRKRIQVEREELNRKLLERSRSVGMADVASTVLHNVGNVLNSVNISVDVAMRALKRVPIDDIALLASLLQQHRHELVHYLSEDVQGKQIPSYLTMLAESMTQNQALVESELIGLSRNVDHIRQVVDRQVHLARSERPLWEPVCFQHVMEQALAIHRPTLDRRGYEIVERYDKELEGLCDRHQVLQILVNLVSNAQKAMEALPDKPHRLTLQVGAATDRPGFVRFEVIDTGMGIASDHLPRLFTQRFTTRSDGHGIGLHSAMLAAKNLGGTLQAHSDGPGQGATFILDLPVSPVEAPV